MQHVLVIEDHVETRQWLVAIVKEAFSDPVVKEAGTLEQAYACLETFIPSVMLVDLSLPDGSGIELLSHAQQHLVETYLVVTTIYDDDHHLFSALKTGASGYLLKDQPRHTLVEALSGIMTGKPPLTPAIARRILRHFQQVEDKTTDNPLSEREKEVLVLLAKGMGRSDIAELLEVSAHTAAGHTKSIYRKLNVSGRVEATLEAVKMGLVTGMQKND